MFPFVISYTSPIDIMSVICCMKSLSRITILRCVYTEGDLSVRLMLAPRKSVLESYHFLQGKNTVENCTEVSRVSFSFVSEQSHLFDLLLPFNIFFMNLPSLTIFGHTLDELIRLDIWRYMIKRRALCILTVTIFCRFQRMHLDS